MSYELIIAEKPQSAQKIAEAIAQGKPIKHVENKVAYFDVTVDNKDVVVAAAVGHLYSLKEVKKKKGWTYPIFDVEWCPSSEVQKGAAFSKKYLDVIIKLAKKADSFTIATDVDVEGEVIGWNIIRFACKKKDANRMLFSTLTKDELKESYKNKQPHLVWGLAKAGETRHVLDWFYGINLSRALTLAVKLVRGGFKLLTTGRVQGPALKLIVDKEKEIKAFVPVPYWQLTADVLKGEIFIANHQADKFWDQKQVTKIFEKIKKEKKATVSEIETKEYNQKAPTPFDLTTLQTESHKLFSISPNRTLQLAQNLYTNSYISYPRTSSQKLPDKIGFKQILEKLAKQPEFKERAQSLLAKKSLKPNEGKKIDEAHPAIYPTGEVPKKLSDQELKLYDLIVKRFMAVFGDDAVRESMTVTLDIKEEPFLIEGKRTVKEGWHYYYSPYVRLEEVTLPAFKKKETLDVKKIDLLSKETTPPKRYTQSSIIKELDKRNLGTKATRSAILETLYDRGYIQDEKIQATQLGIKTIDTLDQHAHKIVDEALTSYFEQEMERIQKDEVTPDAVLKEARDILTGILETFKANEKQIGEALSEAEQISYEDMNTLGDCQTCKKGKLQIKRSKFGMFVGCSGYPDCRQTYSLPKLAKVKPAKRPCEHCTFPVVKVRQIKQGEREVCINPKCITWTPEWQKQQKLIQQEKKEQAAIEPDAE